jgi:hypothetical protein
MRGRSNAPGATGLTAFFGGAGATGGGLAGLAANVAAGAIAGAAGSIASQGVGVATGIQDKFSWNAVALAAIGGAVGGSGSKLGVGGREWGSLAARGMVANALTQGIGVATGLQKDFSWAGVAAAGVGAAVGARFGGDGFGATIVRSSAHLVADAGTRSLIEGTDFGDNVLAALPNAIGQTIGESIAGAMTGRGATRTGAPDTGKTPQTAKQVIAAECGEGYISAFDAFSTPTKTAGGVKPIGDKDPNEIVVIGRRRSLLDRIGGSIADTLGFDGQFFYDGYSPDRRFSLGNFGRAWSGANSFYLEYSPSSPIFNARGDAGRTALTFGAAVVDIPAAIGRGFNNAINAPLSPQSTIDWYANGMPSTGPTPTFGEFVGPVLGEMTGVPAMSRARDHFQAVESLSAIGDQAGAISHAQSFMLEGGSAALAYTGYAAQARAISGEISIARSAPISSLDVPQGYTRAYRAVSDAEFADIVSSGRFNVGPNSMEGKWFADSIDGAVLHGDGLQGAGRYRIIEADLPDAAPSLYRLPDLDGNGPARYVGIEDLDGVTPRPLWRN